MQPRPTNTKENMKLEDLKVGDKVLVINHICEKVKRVIKVTQTLIIVSEYGRFRKSDGRLSGNNGFSTTHIVPLTEEMVAKKEAELFEEQRRNEISYKIRNTDFLKLSTDKLERILQIIAE